MAKKRKRLFRKVSKREHADIVNARRLGTERHLRMTIEDWRLKKRQEWRAVKHAVSLFDFGSAYTPAGNDLYEIQKAVKRISESMDADWICW